MREFKRERGYITIAQQSGEIDYLRMAYGLALSLKATQSEVSDLTVFVTPGTKIPAKYEAVFDDVIDIPWGDAAERYDWKIHNKWKMYHATPYRESILLDADMIFPTDISNWWGVLSGRDVWCTSRPVTYKGEPVRVGTYRQAFIENQLPMLYTAFMYFKHGDVAHEFFDVTASVYHGWRKLYNHYQLRKFDDDVLAGMDYHRSPDRHSWSHFFKNFPPEVSGDLAFAVATKIMGAEDHFTSDATFPTFTHMKPGDQGITPIQSAWTDMFPFAFHDDLTLVVGPYRQQYPFHYVEKDWLSDDIIRTLEIAAYG